MWTIRSDGSIYAPKQKWHKEVVRLGGGRCIACGVMCNQQYRTRAEAHHIMPKAQFPELQCSLDNGVTLCHSCHFKLHYCSDREIQKACEDYQEERIIVSIPKELRSRIEAAAEASGESLNEYVGKAVSIRYGSPVHLGDDPIKE